MSIAYIALGANLEKPADQVRCAINELDQIENASLINASSLYRTTPIDAPGQPDYVNAVACLETSLSPHALLHELLGIEKKFGRTRDFYHAPRTLDLDLLLYDDLVIETEELSLPHPRMHLRAFVLVPLHEIFSTAKIPGRGSVIAWLPATANQYIEKLET